VALIAFHFHWSRKEIMDLSNSERRKWLREINSINSSRNLKMRMMMEERREPND